MEMIGLFIEHNPRDMAELETAIAKADFKEVFKVTHRLRNTILFFGLNPIIGAQLQQIELLAGGKHGLTEIKSLFSETKPVFEQAVKELSDLDLATFQ